MKVQLADERWPSLQSVSLLFLNVRLQDLPVCRGSSATGRLKSGAGNYRFTPLAKIRV